MLLVYNFQKNYKNVLESINKECKTEKGKIEYQLIIQ